jgi:sirohydrochlorin cobaltochelatase
MAISVDQPLAAPMRRAGLILLAHGARDPRWAEPFVRVADKVRRAAPDLRLELAYLEGLEPSLGAAARALAAAGAQSIRIVPLFFGRGGHLREDVPALIERIGPELPGVTLELAEPAGEDEQVIEAIAGFCLRSAGFP